MNHDCAVDEAVLAVFYEAWLTRPWDVKWWPDADLNTDGQIDLGDFSGLGRSWLSEMN